MFSVIIPLYNKEKSVSSTLQTVLNQTFKKFEVIVVDDGSTDGSYDVVKQFKDERIRLIQKENGGVSSARNRGIQETKYDHVAFLDADDVWEPNYLEVQHGLIKDLPKAKMWGCNYAHINGNEKELLYTGLPLDFKGYVLNYFTMSRTSDLFCSSSVVIKKDAFEVAGIFDERIRYSEDLDMWYRIIAKFPVVFCATVLVHYRHDAENRAMLKPKPYNQTLFNYVDKYECLYVEHPDFQKYIALVVAAHSLPYYFGKNKDEYILAKRAVGVINLKKVPLKYRLMYKSPFYCGYCIYILIRIYKRIRR